MDPDLSRQPRRGPGLLELTVAVTALIVALGTLVITRQQTEVMDRQLAASIWPAIQYSTSNLQDGDEVITLAIENTGVGPARIRRFSILHEGREVTDLNAFVRDCCDPQNTGFGTITSFVEGRILPAGEEVPFFVLPVDGTDRQIFEAFDRVRNELDVSVCYCSVLEDCWIATTPGNEPRDVDSCEEAQEPADADA